jgi:hypothetical protein
MRQRPWLPSAGSTGFAGFAIATATVVCCLHDIALMNEAIEQGRGPRGTTKTFGHSLEARLVMKMTGVRS